MADLKGRLLKGQQHDSGGLIWTDYYQEMGVLLGPNTKLNPPDFAYGPFLQHRLGCNTGTANQRSVLASNSNIPAVL